MQTCPACGGPQWDNRQNKKNPKGPDFTCQDKQCRYTLDKETGEYTIPSKFPTGVWLPKTKENAPKHFEADLIKENRDDGQSKGNAKNIAGLWVAHGIITKEEWKDYCDKIFSYDPKRITIGAKSLETVEPRTRAGKVMKHAMEEEAPMEETVNVDDIPLALLKWEDTVKRML